MYRKYNTLEERFMANSVAQWNTALQSYCWIWVGARVEARSQAYGKLNVHIAGKGHTQLLAHRAAFEVFKGEKVPNGFEVDHACGIGLCVAPDHLKAMPHRENMLLHYQRKR